MEHHKSKLRAIIVDDEPLARVGLSHLLKNIPRVEIIAEAANGFEALELVDGLKPDLLFLDIQMPGLNGFEVLQHIAHVPLIIFTTAYDQYALKAFETLALDYLLKPVRLERLKTAIEKVNALDERISKLDPLLNPARHPKQTGASYLRRFVSRQGTKWHVIEEDHVILFYAEEKHSFLKTQKGNYIINYTLQNLETKLDPGKFLRVHRSAIVALKQVQKIKSLGSGRLELILSDGTTQDVSRTYSQDARKRLLGKEET